MTTNEFDEVSLRFKVDSSLASIDLKLFVTYQKRDNNEIQC